MVVALAKILLEPKDHGDAWLSVAILNLLDFFYLTAATTQRKSLSFVASVFSEFSWRKFSGQNVYE